MRIPVARLWHRKGKLEYFCIQQLLKHFPDIDFEWHIVLHSFDYRDEWSDKIDKLGINVKWYSTQDMHDYAKNCGYIDDDLIQKIPNFVHFYHMLIFHYLRRVLMYDYALAYEYDIIFNSDDLSEISNCIKNKTPFGIIEPANSACDKALYPKLCELFQVDILKNNPYAEFGVNAGFQGMGLKMFDNFLNPGIFKDLLSCFDLSGIYKEDGTEKTGWTRTIIDTQEQSFHSLMNRVHNEDFKILDPKEYYFYPSYLSMEVLLKSKVIHYFGHTKPQEFIDTVEEKLKRYE